MSWLAFLVAVAYVPGVPSATLVGRWWVVAVGAAILLLRTPRLRPTPVHWVGAALILWCAASMIWSWSRWDTLGGLVHLLALAGVFCVAAEGEGSLSAAPAMAAFGLGLVPSAAIAIGQHFGWQPVLNISDHPVGLFLSKNAATEAAAPVLVWCAVSVAQKRNDVILGLPCRESGLLIVIGSVALIVAGLAHAAEAWLMLLAAGLVVCYRWAGHVDRDPPAGISCRLGVLATGLGIFMLAVAIVATWPENETHSLNERLAIWQVTLNAWWLHPVLGYGLGTYSSLLFDFEYAHDDYLQALFEIGPIGLALLAAFFATVLLPGRHDLAGKAALASILASALVWWPLQGPASGFLAMVLAGGLVGAGRRVHAAQPERGDHGGARLRPPWRHGTGAVWPAAARWDHMAY